MLMRDPIPLTDDAIDDITAYLRIETADEDALIASLIATALVRAEAFCGQMFVARNVTERIVMRSIAFAPEGRSRQGVQREWQMLGALPVQSISQVNMVALDGTATPLTPGQFAIDIDAEGRGWVRITDASILGRLDVFYAAGLAGGWDTIPEAIRHGVIRLVSYLYTSRDAAGDSGPPAAVAALLRPWRRMRLT